MQATPSQRSTERERDGIDRSDVYEEALILARAIETLLESVATRASGTEGYGLRLTEAMTRSLIDQLDELKRVRAA